MIKAIRASFVIAVLFVCPPVGMSSARADGYCLDACEAVGTNAYNDCMSYYSDLGQGADWWCFDVGMEAEWKCIQAHHCYAN